MLYKELEYFLVLILILECILKSSKEECLCILSFSQANISQGIFNIRFCKHIIYLKHLAGQVSFSFHFIWKHEDTIFNADLEKLEKT